MQHEIQHDINHMLYRLRQSHKQLRMMLVLRRADLSVEVRIRDRFRFQVIGLGGVLPTTSHSMFYSRVDQIAILSHCQP